MTAIWFGGLVRTAVLPTDMADKLARLPLRLPL